MDKFVNKLLDLMKENDTNYLSLDKDQFHIKLVRDDSHNPSVGYKPEVVSPPVDDLKKGSGKVDLSPNIADNQILNDSNSIIIKSEYVGFFYISQPNKTNPIIKIGDVVKTNDTIGIVRRMNIYNEIKSKYDGVIEEIYLGEGRAVEYDQPLIRIKRVN